MKARGRWRIAPHGLLLLGFSAWAFGAVLAFAVFPGGDGLPEPTAWRYAGVVLFSPMGGMVPGPPVVGWVAGLAGDWRWTWAVTGSCALAGMGLGMALRRELRRDSLS